MKTLTIWFPKTLHSTYLNLKQNIEKRFEKAKSSPQIPPFRHKIDQILTKFRYRRLFYIPNSVMKYNRFPNSGRKKEAISPFRHSGTPLKKASYPPPLDAPTLMKRKRRIQGINYSKYTWTCTLLLWEVVYAKVFVARPKP